MAMRNGHCFTKDGRVIDPIKRAQGGTVGHPDRRAGVPMSRTAQTMAMPPAMKAVRPPRTMAPVAPPAGPPIRNRGR